jgi:hypothetical protein
MSDKVECPRQLTEHEVLDVEWDEYTTEEILTLIDCGSVKREWINHYYCNSQWDETP